jgi:hypothetical protein
VAGHETRGASWGKKRLTSIMHVGCKARKAGKDCAEAPYKQDKGRFATRPVRSGPGDERQALHLGARRPRHGGRQAIITVETDRKYRARYCG